MSRARTRQIKASKIVFSLTESSRNHRNASESFVFKAVLRRNRGVKKRAELRRKSISGLFFKVASPKSITAVALRLLMKLYPYYTKLAQYVFIAISEPSDSGAPIGTASSSLNVFGSVPRALRYPKGSEDKRYREANRG